MAQKKLNASAMKIHTGWHRDLSPEACLWQKNICLQKKATLLRCKSTPNDAETSHQRPVHDKVFLNVFTFSGFSLSSRFGRAPGWGVGEGGWGGRKQKTTFVRGMRNNGRYWKCCENGLKRILVGQFFMKIFPGRSVEAPWCISNPPQALGTPSFMEN